MKFIYSLLILIFISSSIAGQTTSKESEKIATFCKIWGFLKYYHPIVSTGKFDWDIEFLKGINSLDKLNSK